MTGRLRSNFRRGTLAGSITNVATAVTSVGFASLPVVASPDTLVIVLDPDGIAGNPEIVTVTAHTSASTSITVTRGAEGTTARAHALGIAWVHAPTALDFSPLLNDVGLYRLMGCVIRNMTPGTAGGWDFITLGGHHPVGFSDCYSGSNVGLTFTEPALEIVTFVVVPDETLAAQGIIVGASVSLTDATIIAYHASDFTAADAQYIACTNPASAGSAAGWSLGSTGFSFNSYSSGTLILNTPTIGGVGYDLQISPRNPASGSLVVPVINSIGVGTVSLSWYNPITGAKITAASTDMRLFIRAGSLASSTPASLLAKDYGGNPGNLWVFGIIKIA